MHDFTARVDRQGDQVTVTLSGELDIATSPILDGLLEGITGPIRFDCADLAFVDSSGLAIFARVERNGGAALRDVKSNVKRVLEVAALDGLIDQS